MHGRRRPVQETDRCRDILRSMGQAYTEAEFASLTLIARDDGTRITLGDVATVVDGFRERETQVINLVLHGHSTKTVADKLSISMETVKLHRKHAYAKLEVSSQAELFYLFLDSVMSARDYDGGDTLVSYMRPPGTP